MSKFIDFHVLQSVPASCINRDDSGMPKTVLYGGSLRSRVSSQAWKKAIRDTFKKQSDGADWLLSHRTKHMARILANEMQKPGSIAEADALQKAQELLTTGCKVNFDKKKSKDANEPITNMLLMLSNAQIKNLAKFALTHNDYAKYKKDLKELFVEQNSLDLALFGRMVATDATLNCDACCQVAHAFSVNSITPEFDYFTAVDDDSSQGAAMIDSTGYNSGLLYRYANLNLTELMHNLNDQALAKKGLELFIKDFLLSMPTGKENTYGNKTLPSYVLITLRDDTPVNLAPAFETPVSGRQGYLNEAIDKLEKEFQDCQKLVDQPVYTGVISKIATKLPEENNLTDLINHVLEKSGL